MLKELVGVVSIVDNVEEVSRSFAHVGSVTEVLEEIEGGGNKVAHGSGKGQGEELVEVSEGLVEVLKLGNTNEVSEITHDSGKELNNEVERSENGVEGLGGELVVSVQTALEVWVGGLHGVLSRG